MIPTLYNTGLLGGGASGGGAVGGWVELARTTLGGTSDTVSVSSLADKRYYMILSHRITSGESNQQYRLNNDSGSNYAVRQSFNGGSDGTGTSATESGSHNPDDTYDGFTTMYISNLSSKEKLSIMHNVNQQATGAANAPTRQEGVWKWANTSNAVNRIDMVNTSTGDYASGSEVVVLGWDESDTHTNNFWEELASANGSGSSSTFDTGTFTAKKYLWIQAYGHKTGGTANFALRVGNSTIDTGSNYARRSSTDGGADGTATSTNVFEGLSATDDHWFLNMFVVNNASNEKLFTGHVVELGDAGAANAPQRLELVGKWTNTSNQIDIIQILSTAGTGDWSTTAEIKVWGAD